MTQSFDAIVIGAGQAGPSLAVRLAGAGQSVAIVERHLFGGTCVNAGCIPTKTLVASAKVAQQIRRAGDYGIQLPGAPVIDWSRVKERKDAIVHESRTGVESWLRATPGCTVITGHARFVGPCDVQVGDQVLTAKQIFINVGGRPQIPDLPGVAETPYLTSTSILDLTALPKHLLIVGGSYIGLEFAQMFRRFGSEVTLVERGERLLAREDPEVSESIRRFLEEDGIAIHTQAACLRIGRHAEGVEVTSGAGPDARRFTGSHVLLAVGRRPNTDDLGLEVAKVERDEHGFVRVNERLESSAPGIWALGECTGNGAFTHVAYNDYEIVAANLLEGASRRTSDRIACYGLFIDPPLGRVGLTETQARDRGRPVRVGVRPMTRVGRAREMGETKGFMKVVVDAATEEILGASILGVHGDEAVHCILDTMSAGGNAATLRRTMHIHPTVAELIPTVFGELK